METQVVFSEVIDVNEGERSADVICDGSFKSLLLAQSTLDNLHKCGFKKPSPVQMRAIPPGMAGLDMLVQAKSGTGKTLVFAILATENLKLSSKAVQKLVIAPTREIAVQIGDTIAKIGAKGTRIAVITGGTSVHEDKEKLKKGVHIVVGTPGRLCQLVNEESLNLGSLSLFVLDEADKMMSGDFEKDVNFIYSCVSSMRQVAVFSATYPPHLASSLIPFLRSPIHIRLNAHDVQLIGVKQYIALCIESNPIDAAITAFSSIQYKQAFLFCNKAEDCPFVANRLSEKGIEAAAISAQLEQSQRDDVMKRLKSNKIKVVVSTDLTARGVDADNVDLVINIEAPFEIETYFHRIGRAARYGGQGASLTIFSAKKSLSRFKFFAKNGNITAKVVRMDNIPATLTTDRVFFDAQPLFVTNIGNELNNGDEQRESIYDIANEDNIDINASYRERDELTADYSNQLDDALSLSSNLRGISVADERKENVNLDGKKKFKFVPSRSKKSTKYYMRGEMISIRDAFNCDQWREFAREKFDLTVEPFIMNENGKVIHKEGKVNQEKSEKHVTPSLPSTSTSRNGIKEYTKKDLIAIAKSISAKVWKSYAASRWNLSEEPFVEDQYMRCAYKEQIRLKRLKEKTERDKVVAERNAARIRLISTGTSVFPIKEWNGSFEEYCSHMKEEMERTRGRMMRGPVVSRRRDKEEYARKVEDANEIMERVERNYEYALNMALKGIKEEGVETEKIEKKKIEEEMEAVQVIKHETVMEDEEDARIEENNVEEEEEEADELDEGEDYEEDEEWWDGDETKYGGNQDVQSKLFSCYSRNIEFARVFNAYLHSMSTLH